MSKNSNFNSMDEKNISKEFLRGFLDTAIEAHRSGQRIAFKNKDRNGIAKHSFYVDAYQTVRKAMLGKEKPFATAQELNEMGINE